MWAPKWEREQRIFEKQGKKSQRRGQKKGRGSLWLTGRKKGLHSLLMGEEGVSQNSIPTHAWCWRAQSHAAPAGHRTPGRRFPLPVVLTSVTACQQEGTSAPAGILHFHNWRFYQGNGCCGGCRGVSMLSPHHAGTGHRQKPGSVMKPQKHWEVLQVRQDLGNLPKLSQSLDRTWTPVSPSGTVLTKLELCMVPAKGSCRKWEGRT